MPTTSQWKQKIQMRVLSGSSKSNVFLKVRGTISSQGAPPLFTTSIFIWDQVKTLSETGSTKYHTALSLVLGPP